MKICEFRSKGGLKSPDLQQLATLIFKEEEPSLPAKLVLDIGIEYKSGGYKELPKSLRFDSYPEAVRFLTALVQGIATYGYKKGEINSHNHSWKLAQLHKEVSEKWIATLKDI